MRLLDQAQRHSYRGDLNDHLEASRRARREEEFNAAFAHLDSELAAGNLTQLKYDEVKGELSQMHPEKFGIPETEVGGPGSIIFNEGG